MAKLYLTGSAFPPPYSSPKLTQASPCSSLSTTAKASKPIVVNGNPPSFVSAPGRRIVAGLPFFGCYFGVLTVFQVNLSTPTSYFFELSLCFIVLVSEFNVLAGGPSEFGLLLLCCSDSYFSVSSSWLLYNSMKVHEFWCYYLGNGLIVQ